MKGELLYMHAPHQHANSIPPFRKVCMATGMHSLLKELIELQVSEVQGYIIYMFEEIPSSSYLPIAKLLPDFLQISIHLNSSPPSLQPQWVSRHLHYLYTTVTLDYH